ncbi:MAG: FAD:protein FMN transferase, partial [Acidimicrobiia bacterium]
MKRIDFAAMGTQVEAWVETGGATLIEWFDEVEETCSRFLPDSELTRLNVSAPGEFEVSGLMADVLAQAWEVRSLTSGLVDIGVGAAVTGWGYDRTFESVTDLASEPIGCAEPSWSVEGDTVTLGRGTRLDLGGVAKGWACDRAVDRGLAAVVSAGGDMRSGDPE